MVKKVLIIIPARGGARRSPRKKISLREKNKLSQLPPVKDW